MQKTQETASASSAKEIMGKTYSVFLINLSFSCLKKALCIETEVFRGKEIVLVELRTFLVKLLQT